jgi:ATP-dependent Clp protease protease subunit
MAFSIAAAASSVAPVGVRSRKLATPTRAPARAPTSSPPREMASFRGLKAAPVGLTKTVASLRDAVRAQSRSNGKGTRSVATMMPNGVPRVPYKTPNENSWQWVDIWNCLYRERIVWIGQQIDDELGNQLVATMLYLDTTDKSGKDIYLYINSEGGEVVPTMAILDTMKHIKSDVGCVGFGSARAMGGAFYLTLVPIRPRSRGERRFLRTFPGASLRPGSLAFNPRPRRL